MVDEDELRELKAASKTVAWFFLLGLFFVTSAARGVYSSVGVAPSGRFELLSRVGLVTFLWYWVRSQLRPYRASFPLDTGFFLSGLWFFMLPHYLWRYERWRGLLKCAVLGVAALLAYVLSIVLHYVLVAAHEPTGAG